MRALVLLSLVSVAAAAGGFLRAFHASPDAPAVNVVVNDNTAITGLVYGTASSFLPVGPGAYDVKIVPTSSPGTIVLRGTVTIVDGIATTAVARGRLASIGLDLFTAATNQTPTGCSIRVAHLSPDAPAVDVLLNGMAALKNVSFPEFAPPIGHIGLPAGSYNVAVNAAGSSTTVLSTRYACSAGVEQTIAVIGFLSGHAEPLKFAVLNDNTPSRRHV